MPISADQFIKDQYRQRISIGVTELDLLFLVNDLNRALLTLKFIQDCEPDNQLSTLINTLTAYRMSICEQIVTRYAMGISMYRFTDIRNVEECIRHRLS